MDNNTCNTAKSELAAIIDKIEDLDNSMRISMICENRQDDPLARSWMHILQDISNDLHRLAGISVEPQ